MKRLHAMWQARSGASAPEYALILAVIGAVIILSVLYLSGVIGGSIDQSGDCISDSSFC